MKEIVKEGATQETPEHVENPLSALDLSNEALSRRLQRERESRIVPLYRDRSGVVHVCDKLIPGNHR